MIWVERLNQSISYIEAHLADEIDIRQLARIACCSSFHYQRMFTYMAGIPLSEYIRRRRMSLAAAELQGSAAKITDIAVKYGYHSPTAFNRAFQSVHGVAPSAVKRGGIPVKSYPPFVFHLTISGGEEMEYRLETKDAFRVLGISAPLQHEVEKNFMVVPGLWQDASQNGTLPKLAEKMDAEPRGLLGVSACGDGEAWRYFIAVASTKERGAFEEYRVPASNWAIFSGAGPNTAIQELERRIVTEWLPASGYEYADAPDIEVYLNPDPDNARFEVWIPVVKK